MKFVLLSLILFSSNWGFAESTPPLTAKRRLSIAEAITLAEENNLSFESAKFTLMASKIVYDNAWDTMFLPSISLSTYSSQTWNLGALPGSAAKREPNSAQARGYPSSSVSLSMGAYTLYNFGRDRLAYENQQTTYQRAQQTYYESRRALRYQVMNAYFTARVAQQQLDVAKRSYQISNTIRDLIQSRIKIQQATQEELESVSVDATSAKITYDQTYYDVKTAFYSLNQFLNLSPEDPLELTTSLDFIPMNFDPNILLKVYATRSPTVLSLKASHQIAQANLEIAEKNRLPLPEIRFNGITVRYGNEYHGKSYALASSDDYRPGGALDISASVSMTLPLVGSGGFLNKRNLELARIDVDSAQNQLKSAMLSGEINIRTTIQNLLQLQERIKNLKLNLDQSIKLLDRVVEGMASKRISRLELRDAIETARNSEISYLQAINLYRINVNSVLNQVGLDSIEELKAWGG